MRFKISEKTKIKMRESALNRIKKGTQKRGWKLTEEQKRSHAMFGNSNPSKREDVKEKMRKAKIGKGLSIEEYKRRRLLRRRTYYYVKIEKIKKTPCKVCGNINVEIHHLNYETEYEVIFLCKIHHKELHKTNNTYKIYKRNQF